MHPAEFVITVRLSEIAASCAVDRNISLMKSVSAAAVLVSFEIISSFIAMKSERYRKLTEGNPVMIISDGKIDMKELEKLRMSRDDVFEALRQKDVFNIKDVKYGIMETSGMLSVLLKNQDGGNSN